MKREPRSRTSVSVEVFGWLDFVLGVLVLVWTYQAAALLRLPALNARDAALLRLVATLVTALGLLYIVSGRARSEGFAVASLLDRPLVPVIMLVLWLRHIVPGPAALLFSVTDFGGFLWTLLAWRADARRGLYAGGPDLPRQSRGGRALECLGVIQIVAGFLVLLAPHWTASLLQLPPPMESGPDYFRLAGLLVGGLGVLDFVSGTFSARGVVVATLIVRPTVAGIFIVLVSQGLIQTPIAVAGIAYELMAFIWTLYAWIEDGHEPATGVPLFARCVASLFALVSALRGARTFHPDGRLFRGSVQPLQPWAASLQGDVKLRVGMGLAKKRTPAWLADRVPDAPSIACRFGSGDATLDLLCTAGGDRLWKLVLNLATGGRNYGLNQFDYFANHYFAQVPYRVDDGKADVWLRIAPEAWSVHPNDGVSREAALTAAVARRAMLRLEAQRAGDPKEPFAAIAEIHLEEEVEGDQEALHFDPVAGAGFVPHGFFTGLRKIVYPSSVQSRPATAAERERRGGIVGRFAHYLNERPVAWNGHRRWVTLMKVALLVLVVAGVLSLLERFTRDVPYDPTCNVPYQYAKDELHFMRGSTGGERRNGIPYWYWVALPELFPELLPDKTPGCGYSSFGLAYDPKDDPRYALPYGVSMRNVRGIDVVYLNCGACHIGTVRDAPGAPPRLIVAGMPAHQFDLGAFGRFLMNVPRSEKFNGARLIDQIRIMQDDPGRVVDKPDLINRLLLEYVAPHLMREQLLILSDRLKFIDTTTWGPGRVDTFNAPKALLNFPMDKASPNELMGNVDFPSVWNQRPREGMQLHWDGNNTKVAERNLSAAFGTGAYPANIDAPRVQRMERWLDIATPPEYPYPKNDKLFARGAALYKEYCVDCHGTKEPPFRGKKVGTVEPIDEIGTDRWRLDSYTRQLAVNQSTLYAGFEKEWGFDGDYPQRFSNFCKTDGYANMPLDGIWLRAPYLHNGSVPNLWELLKPAAQRVQTFYNGNDVYDPVNVGFVYDVPEQNGRKFFLIDTYAKGNGNGGHEGEAYGTNLSDGDKWALIEYLKTF